MHQVVETGLEDFLAGRSPREVQSHLEACTACRDEVQAMQEISQKFSAFVPANPPAPPLGFAARVTRNAAAAAPRSFWSAVSINPGLIRRMAFASLMGLAALGSYLVVQERNYTPVPDSPVEMMADHNFTDDHMPSADRGRMMVTLASYDR